jgi:hypothetical protein
LLEVEHAGADQILIHHRVEVAVIDDVVDVAVDVVVHPACGDRQKMRVGAARGGCRFVHRDVAWWSDRRQKI